LVFMHPMRSRGDPSLGCVRHGGADSVSTPSPLVGQGWNAADGAHLVTASLAKPSRKYTSSAAPACPPVHQQTSLPLPEMLDRTG